MEDKVYLSNEDKIKVLEANNGILLKQNEALLLHDRFLQTEALIKSMQENFSKLINDVVKSYGFKNGNIQNDYSIVGERDEVA